MKKFSSSSILFLVSLLLAFQLASPLVNVYALTNNTMLPPSNLTFQLITPSDVKLTWSSVYGATGYNVYGITDGQLKPLGTTTSASYTSNNLPEGSYSYVVSTLSADGESGPCAPVSVDVVYPNMTAPATLTSKILNGNDIVLSWTASQYAQTYNLYQISTDGAKTLVTSTKTSTCTITNAAAGAYTYAVSAVNSLYGESTPSTPAQVQVTYPTMTAPSNLTYSLSNGNDVTLKWNAASYATSYKIYQVVDGEKTLKSTITGTSITYANMLDGNYAYEVHSYSDRFGESQDGSQISFNLVLPTMQAPGNISSTITNGNDITLKWNAVSYATGYKVYQLIDGQKVLKSTIPGTTVSYTNMPAGDYAYEVHSYSTRFGESQDGSQTSFTLVLPTMDAPGGLEYNITNGNDITLKWGTIPYATGYKVYQIVNGQKVLKSTVTGTTVTYTNMAGGDYVYEIHSYSSRFGESQDGSSITFSLIPPVMEAPANLVKTIKNATDFTLSWDASPYATGYKVYQISNGQKVLKSTVSGTTVSYTNMSPGDYYLEVHSYSARFGESSDGSNITVTLNGQIMPAPTSLTYSITNGNDITLKWAAVPYATSYKIYQLINGQLVLNKTLTGVSATFTNMPAGNYDYVVTSFSTLLGESPTGAETAISLVLPTMGDPGNLAYKIQNGNDVVLTWSSVTYANSYKVYELIDGQLVLKTTVTSTSATLTNVLEGDHVYIVKSLSTRFGESLDGSQVAFSVVYPTMAAPANFTYSIANGNDITLKWNSVSYITSYKIYQIIDGEKVLKQTLTGTSATFTNMAEGDYNYEVYSYSSRFGESQVGSSTTFSLNYPTMQAPSSFTYSIANGNDITLKWLSVPYATNYKVYQIINGEKVLKQTVTGTAVTFANMPAGDYNYEIYSYSSRFGESPLGSETSFTLVFPTMQAPANLINSTANGNDVTLKWTASTYATTYKVYQIIGGEKILKQTVTGTSITFVNMPAGDYSYEVHSYSSRFGESPIGSTVNFTLIWPVVQPPILNGTVFNVNNITLAWNSVSWANEYRVYEIINDTKQLLYKGTALSYKVYNLSEATHKFQVTAYSTRFGESNLSNQLTETIIYPVMQSPTASLKLIDKTTAQISWNFVTYANGYNVYEIIDNNPVLLVKNLNNLSYTISNLSYSNHQYFVTSYSNSFGESDPSNTVLAKLIVDNEAPVTTSNAPTYWTNQGVTLINLSATDNETGVSATYYSINDGSNLEGTSLIISNEGTNKISFYSVDKVGNQETQKTAYVNIDKTAPATTCNAPEGWSKNDVNLKLTAVDALSGVDKIFYSIDDSSYQEGTSFTITTEGIHKVCYYSIDAAGNIEAINTAYVKIDKTAPVTTSNAPANWSKDDVTINLAAADALSGVVKTFYSIDDSNYLEGTSFTITTEGIHKVCYYSVDAAGNIETVNTAYVKIDKTAPVTTSNASESWSKDDVTVNLAAEDTLSGVVKTFYSIDDSNYIEGTSFTITTEGIHKVSFYSVDAAGNVEIDKSIYVKIDKTAPTIVMNLWNEFKLGSTPQLSYLRGDNLSGIADEKMIVFGPNETTGKTVSNGTNLLLDKPGVYTVNITVTDAAGNSSTLQKHFTVYIPANIEVTAKVIKGNNGVFTVRVSLPSVYSTEGFDLNTATVNGVNALTSNNGYYNQAKIGQFKFERSDFNWTAPEVTVQFRGYVNGNLVVGQTTVKVQK